MKILLDEQLSRRLRRMLGDHEVATTAYQGWKGVQNGALLRLAEHGGFDVFLTADKNLYFQQNLSGRKLGVVVLSTNKFPVRRARIESIALAIENCSPGSVTLLELG